MPRLTAAHYGKGRALKRPKWHIENYLRSNDNFAKDLPMFNINGKSTIGTVLGGVLTMLLMILTISYAASTLLEVMQPENPVVNVNDHKDYYENQRLNFNEADVRFAIGIYGDQDLLSKTDTRYTKWFGTY